MQLNPQQWMFILLKKGQNKGRRNTVPYSLIYQLFFTDQKRQNGLDS
jgi:hypothetical protein